MKKPTANEIIDATCVRFDLNPAQQNTLCDHYEALTNESREKFIEGLKNCKTDDDVIYGFIVPYNLKKMNNGIRDKIAAGQYTCMSVGPGENNSSPGFAYSIGLSVVSDIKAEIVVAGHTECSNVIIDEAHGILLNNPHANGVHELKSITPNRIRIVKIQDVETFTLEHFARIDQWLDSKPETLYLVQLADKNNVLPGEYGYDVSYLQLKLN